MAKQPMNRVWQALGLLVAPSAVLVVGGCNGVLGIDAAQSDPQLGVDASSAAFDSGATSANDAATVSDAAGSGGDGASFGGGDGATGVGDAGAADVPDSSYALDCASYCATSIRDCTLTTDEAGAPQDNTEYIDPSTCLQMCNVAFPTEHGGLVPVDPAPDSANTLACRIWHTNYAVDHGAQVHCPHGGPLGGETCGDLTSACNVFCTLAAHFCSDVYETPEACNRACLPNDAGVGGFPYRIGTGIPDLDQSADGSNTLNCRIYHLQAAITYDKTLHCPHTAPNGGGKCVDPVPVTTP